MRFKRSKHKRPGFGFVQNTACFFLFLFVTSIVFLNNTPATNASIFGKQTEETFTQLTGFEPGARVEYAIKTTDGKTLERSAVIDAQGQLKIPMIELPDSLAQKIRYDFKIIESQKTHTASLIFDRVSGETSILGETDTPFSDVQISGFGKQIETKTDWAGLFENTGLKKVEKFSKEPIQVAFYSRDIASDARNTPSKSVIKVLAAPGGGGPTNSNVNQYTESLCPPGFPNVANLSTCNTGVVNGHSQDIVNNYVHAMQMMTEQLNAVAIQSTEIIGSFLDAKLQMENQRKHQELKARAVKDYHPSEQMCRIGSYVRSIAVVEEKAKQDYMVLNDVLMESQSNRLNMATSVGKAGDHLNRLQQYREVYCDPNDNNAQLRTLCTHGGSVGAADNNRKNKDIDFARTAEYPHTLEVDFRNANRSDDEEDVIALGRNLYWDTAFDFIGEPELANNKEGFYKARQHQALNALAHRSYSKYVAMKAEAGRPTGGVTPGWAYMKTLMRDLMGATSFTDNSFDTQIDVIVGENPSYYSQMDILTKKMYQNPDFFTNLYDKPVNVERILTSLEAISLMQLRDHYDAALRHEMLISGMVEAELIPDVEALNGRINDINTTNHY